MNMLVRALALAVVAPLVFALGLATVACGSSDSDGAASTTTAPDKTTTTEADATGGDDTADSPEKAAFLGFASTLPEARGSGIGVALTDAGFAWAAEQGYEVMVTDWRVTNLLSSRFWPRRGFRETFLRLYRSIP